MTGSSFDQINIPWACAAEVMDCFRIGVILAGARGRVLAAKKAFDREVVRALEKVTREQPDASQLSRCLHHCASPLDERTDCLRNGEEPFSASLGVVGRFLPRRHFAVLSEVVPHGDKHAESCQATHCAAPIGVGVGDFAQTVWCRNSPCHCLPPIPASFPSGGTDGLTIAFGI